MPQKSPKGVTRPPVLTRQDVCSHVNRVPVELLRSGERVAQLCLDCDAQLEPDYAPRLREHPGGAVFSGVGAYWADEAAELTRQCSTAAAVLVNAGFSPADVADIVYDHAARDCPKRIEITQLSDREPRYIHGNCEPVEQG